MKKRAFLVAVVLFFTLVASSYPSSQVRAATSYSYAEQMVLIAESYAGTLKWAISVEGSGDGRTIPWKLYNGTKDAYQQAVKAVSVLPSGVKKTELQNRLEDHVNLYISVTPGKIGRAVAYIDAITAGKKIEKQKVVLEDFLKLNIINDSTEDAYHTLSGEMRKQAYLLDRVYGLTTREAIRSIYKYPAEELKRKALYPVSVKMALDELEGYLQEENYAAATVFQDEVDALFNTGKELGLLGGEIERTLRLRYDHIQYKIPLAASFMISKDGVVTVKEDRLSYWPRLGYKFDEGILEDAHIFSMHLYESVTEASVQLRTGSITETVFTGENIHTAEVDLNTFKQKYSLAELNSITVVFQAVNSRGRTVKQEIGLFDDNSFVFTYGFYYSDKDYEIEIPYNFDLYMGSNGNEAAVSNIEESGEAGLTIEVLEPGADLALIREESIELLKTLPGSPLDYTDKPELEDELLHLFVENRYSTEEIIVAKIDGRLMKFFIHVDKSYLYIDMRGYISRMMRSIKFD